MTLTTSTYHDAEVTEIGYSRMQRLVCLGFEEVSGNEVHIAFSGVTAFRASDFGLQNVVSRALASTTHAFSSEAIREYVQWANSQHDYKAELADTKLSDLERALSRRELVLFVVEPSVGAEIVVLSESMTVLSRLNGRGARS